MLPLVASKDKTFDGTAESPKRPSTFAGDVLLAANLFSDALPFLERRHKENPEDWMAATNYAACILLMGEIDRSIEILQPLALKDPTNIPVLTDLGLAFAYRGEHNIALKFYQEAYRLDPKDKTTMLNLGAELMKAGDWANGQWLWEGGRFCRSWSPPTGMKVYTDQSLEGKKLLVLREGGYGDMFQFVRFFPKIKAMGCELTVTVWDRQIPVLQESGVEATLVPATELTNLNPDDYDYVTSICSIPFVARATNPEWGGPYLVANAAAKERFTENLARIAPRRPRVGLCWAAEEAGGGRSIRSIPVEFLAPIAKLDVSWINLCPRREAPEWLIDPGQQADWSDAAGLVDCLDLVISVDTAIEHLAGGLGKPVWSLLPCFSEWRWGTPDRPTPWYGKQSLWFNGDPYGWGDLMQGVANRLKEIIDRRNEKGD